MKWSEFLLIYSDGPNVSIINEIIEFLMEQDQETLPRDLKKFLAWHKADKIKVSTKVFSLKGYSIII